MKKDPWTYISKKKYKISKTSKRKFMSLKKVKKIYVRNK